jgi:hypothetical protein
MDTFDFVEDPSVMATEEYMQVENKRRQPMKTFAEIKAAYPDVIKEYEDQVAAEKKTLADQVADLTTKFESLQKTSTEKFNKLVSTIKESAPEAFVTVPETDVIKAKDEELKKVNETAAATAKSLSEATAKIQAFETEKTNLLKESEIKTIKGSDADFFKGEANKSIFDNCLNADEVRKVYTDRKALIDSIKKDNNTPAPTKSKDNTQVPAELTEEQKKDMDGRNRDRLRSGIPAMTVDQYKKEWVK